MNPKVCILAAGNGIRMGHYSKIINKALLPVNRKAVISHIIEKFPADSEFVIAVGYKSGQVRDYLSIAHPGHKFTFVEVTKFEGPGSGPGLSVSYCKEVLSSDFYLVCCDTLWIEDIKKFPTTGNWMATASSSVADSANYCNVSITDGNVSALHDKQAIDSEIIWSFTGLLFIKDFELFFKGLDSAQLIKNEKQISSGLEEMIKLGLLKSYSISWTDVGTKEKYIKELKKHENYDFSKADEFIYVLRERIVKFFQNPEIAELRVKKAKINPAIFPSIEAHKNCFYSYPYLPGETLYKHSEVEVFCKFLNWLKQEVWLKKDIDSARLRDLCEKFYFQKTAQRLSLFELKYPGQEPNCINGVEIPSARELLTQLDWHFLYEGSAFFIHGDLQPDNVIYDKSSGNFKLIDWRQEFAGQIEFGDIYYDLAKLLGGLNLNYDQIKLNKFEYSESSEGCKFKFPKHTFFDETQKILKDYIAEQGYYYEKVEILMGLVYLNMSPLHQFPFDKLLHSLGREILFSHQKIN